MDLRPGSIVADRYRVEEQIGAGGHGAVYRVTDTRVGRGVALKVLHPEVLGSGDAAARFEQEALLARDLTHPNTVRLLDFGREADQPYIVYELLEGCSLESTLQHGALGAARVAHITSQILKSLMEAHDRGIVRRDLVYLQDRPYGRAFVVLTDHPYSDVTDKTGEFRIPNVSAGTYELRAWHSLYGDKSIEVTLEVGEGNTATLTYDGTEPAPPGNANERDALDTMF